MPATLYIVTPLAPQTQDQDGVDDAEILSVLSAPVSQPEESRRYGRRPLPRGELAECVGPERVKEYMLKNVLVLSSFESVLTLGKGMGQYIYI